jgi:hypothetical protein
MGAQRAPISRMKTPWVRHVGDITPLVSGLPSPPKAPSTRAHLSRVKGSPVHIRPSRLILATPAEDPGGTGGSPADAARQPRCPATSSGTVLRAPHYHRWLDRCNRHQARSGCTRPEPTDQSGRPGRARRSTRADATRGCPKAHIARRCGRCSFHESSHGSQAGPAGSVTVSNGDLSRENARYPPICADIASMPVRTLLAHIWMFRAA